MASSTVAVPTKSSALVPARVTLPSAANQLFPKGTIVTKDGSDNAVSPSSADASGFSAFGVSQATFDNRTGSEAGGLAGDLDVEISPGVHGLAYTGATPSPGDLMYVVDNQTVSVDDNGATRGRAGVCVELRDGLAWVLMGPTGDGFLTALGATDTTVDELVTSETTAQACVEIPLTSFRLAADGASIPAFSNGVADGFALVESEAFGLRINDDSTTHFATCVGLPNDLDDAAAVVIHVMASKVGATGTDLTKLTFAAFFQTVGATYIADVDCGGDTDAMANPATKTTQEITRTIVAGDVPAAPCALTLDMVVKAGTLADDDLVIHRVWLEYTKKLLTA